MATKKKSLIPKPTLSETDKRKIDEQLKSEQVELNAGYFYEAQHTAHLAQEFINDHLYQHPFIMQHKDLRDAVATVINQLGKVYQMIGNKADQFT
jgi:hypothetical protein